MRKNMNQLVVLMIVLLVIIVAGPLVAKHLDNLTIEKFGAHNKEYFGAHKEKKHEHFGAHGMKKRTAKLRNKKVKK